MIEMKPRAERREERIRRYAYNWYMIRVKYNVAGSEQGDWDKAERLVDAEDGKLTSSV